MMFLQFFIWGAWFVTLGTYLSSAGFSGTEIGSAFLMNNIGAIISPFFIGLIADRFFAAEKITQHHPQMKILSLIPGLKLFSLNPQQFPHNESKSTQKLKTTACV